MCLFVCFVFFNVFNFSPTLLDLLESTPFFLIFFLIFLQEDKDNMALVDYYLEQGTYLRQFRLFRHFKVYGHLQI